MLPVVVAAAMGSSAVQAKIVEGYVEGSTGNPLSEVVVKVRGTDIQVITDSSGRFRLDISPGDYTVDVEGGRDAHFHQDITVTDESDVPLLITMEDEPAHKIVVRANPLEHTALDMATPVIVLAGEELTLKRAGTLGEILKFEPGLSVSSFGPAVSRPVIRGLGGARVQVTNNQMVVQDASSTSADHDVGMEPLLADQIEVVKGPATLLYGSGAIGGVVNISDKKINSDIQQGVSGGIELRLGDDATSEESLIFALDVGTESINWHFDGYSNQSSDLKIPGLAESEALHQQELAEHEGDHDDEHEDDHDDEHEDEVAGILENSAIDSTGGSIGATFVADWGYLGASISRVDKLYGVPGHSEHEEEHKYALNEGEAEDGVRIDMQQTRYDLQAQIDQSVDGIEQWFVGYALTDYEHVELEGSEIGTMFDNRAWEFKTYAKHDSWIGWSGLFGAQYSNRDFSAIGEEAFVPPSETSSYALFWLEEKEFASLKWELGVRYESQDISVQGQNDNKNSGLSFSSGIVYSISSHNKLALNFSRATRFASVEELFSNGAHIATASYEIGNQSLEEEVSNNLDFSYRFETERFHGEINLYVNHFDDFIYGANVSLNDACISTEIDVEELDEELQLICYKQQDAKFRGIELEVDFLLADVGQHEFNLGFFGDYTRAKLNNGEYVPRIPPVKLGVNLQHHYGDFSSQLSWVHFLKQDNLSANELRTEGFDIVDFELSYLIPFEQDDLFIFLKAKNLLDEEARDHASFLKDLAPRAGRNFMLGLRYTF